jgi:hypothetical protein
MEADPATKPAATMAKERTEARIDMNKPFERKKKTGKKKKPMADSCGRAPSFTTG